MATPLQRQLNLRPTTKLGSSAAVSPRAPVDPHLARVPLADKMKEEILSAYLRRARDGDEANVSSTWSRLVQQASMYATHTPPHTEKELKAIVDALLQAFPSLPSDCNLQQKRQLLNHTRKEHHSSSAAATDDEASPRSLPVPAHRHIFDVSPRELLTSRGSSMFPPLQKQTPRSSSGHEKFKTAASEQLLRDERHFSPVRPPPPPIVAHQFGKSNTPSLRRQRNTYAINQTLSSLTSGNNVGVSALLLGNNNNISDDGKKQSHQETTRSILAKVSAMLPSDRPVEASTLHRLIIDSDVNSSSQQQTKFKLANQLTSQELEKFIADNNSKNRSVPGSARSNNNINSNNSINGSRRFGLFFTAPESNHQSSNNNNNYNNNNTTILMTDEMMDRLRDKQQQRRTRLDLDDAITIRRQQLDARKAEFETEKQCERQRSADIAREDAADQAQRAARRREQQALAAELKAAERRRLDEQQAQRREQHRAAHAAAEQNERGIQEAVLSLAVKRHRKEEAARANMDMAEARKLRRLINHQEEKELELRLLNAEK